LPHQVASRAVLIGFVAVLVYGCGVARAFLDLPKASPGAAGDSVRIGARGSLTARADAAPAFEELPVLETTLNRDSLLAMLPRDVTGYVDWVAALDSGLMRPRSAVGGTRYTRSGGPRFGFDFAFAGPDTMFDARFRHSVHAEIIDCRQCHGPIFRYRDEKINMVSILTGEHCGRCHGKVSFPVTTGCKRCHERGPFPAAGGVPELIGDIVMARPQVGSDFAVGVAVDPLPRARFPHSVHRVRYQCRACHEELFKAVAGSNLVTMRDFQQGKACGACHDGTTAFRAGFGNCQRCHVPM